MGWRVKKEITAQDLSKGKDITPGMAGMSKDEYEKIVSCSRIQNQWLQKKNKKLEKEWKNLRCSEIAAKYAHRLGGGTKIGYAKFPEINSSQESSDTHRLEDHMKNLKELLDYSRQGYTMKPKEERIRDSTYKKKLKAMRRLIKNIVVGHLAITRGRPKMASRRAKRIGYKEAESIEKLFEEFNSDGQGSIWNMWLQDIEEITKKKL